MVLERRKRELILRIVDQYIAHAHPVGSVFLVEKYQLDVSSATIRNIMVLLEEEGYIVQPHSSAGRVPTEQAYQYYVQSLKTVRLASRQEEQLRTIFAEEDSGPALLKRLVKEIATISQDVAFGKLGSETVFSAGMSNLFTKPEFDDRELIGHMSLLLDTLDELIISVQALVSYDPEIWIGKDNRLSSQCSTIIMRYRLGDQEGVLGILGPMRMNYTRNTALMHTVRSFLKNFDS